MPAGAAAMDVTSCGDYGLWRQLWAAMRASLEQQLYSKEGISVCFVSGKGRRLALEMSKIESGGIHVSIAMVRFT